MTTGRGATSAGLPAPIRTGTAVAAVPAQLREIAEVAGQDTALKLVARLGGSEIWIPRRATPGHWLTELVGLAAAERICAHYRVTDADGREVGNVRLYVPQSGTGLLDTARRQVREDVAAGLTVRAAARRAGLSERAAHRAVRSLRDGRQGELFQD